MKRKVHTESEMVKAVQELESGIDAETLARNHGISKATLYNWKSKYSGMEVSQVRRLKELEEENRKLNQMYAELALDNMTPMEYRAKKKVGWSFRKAKLPFAVLKAYLKRTTRTDNIKISTKQSNSGCH